MTTVKKFKLTSKGLQNVAKCYHPDDFKFIVGNKEYKCPSFFADFISPRIANCHAIDPCMNYFVVDIDDPNNYFELALDLFHGKGFKILPKQREFFKQLAIIFQNNELLCYALDIATQNLTASNALSSLEEKIPYGLDISKEIEVIASNFYKFKPMLLENLDVNILMRILHSPHLVVNSESSLFEFVLSLVKQNPDYSVLFSAVKFECLKESEVEQFNKIIKFDQMSPLIWAAIKPRLLLKTQPVLVNSRYNRKIFDCLFKKDKIFDGIINFLRARNKGLNPVDVGAVVVTVKVNECSVKPRELFERDSRPRWYLAEKEDNYICLDFVGGKVSIDGYSWGSGNDSSYWEYPVSYTWEGSNDNQKWTIIDQRDENTDMGGNEKTHHWTCKKSPFFRYVRFRLRKIQRNGGLYSTQLELFGQYEEPKKEA